MNLLEGRGSGGGAVQCHFEQCRDDDEGSGLRWCARGVRAGGRRL